MNISYKWLKNYINLTDTPDEVARILTSIGLEVGTVETVQTIKGGLQGLVVGEVLTCVDHENSDHLHVTTVNVGTGEPLQIVCGAPNVAVGQKVIVATVGTILYHGDESYTIKRSKIRGVESVGMICAEDEIGVGTSHDGIMVLPATTPVGMLAKDYFHVEDDALIEVDITPNRADAISHYGVARDLAAYYSYRNPMVKLTRPSVEHFKVGNQSLTIPVEVKNEAACPRYSGLTISGVTIKESPEWLQNALRTIGLHPINNVVDVTNYVMHEMGQPLHSFDAAKIKGGKIIVGNVPQGTKFVTLDGVERTLDASDLMICNGEGEPMCIAGVFGGLESGVSNETTSVFIESAYFDPVSIRKTAHRHGLNTDASFRYERGCDPNNTLYILMRCALLIQEVAGGIVSSEIIDVYPKPLENFKVSMTLDKVHKLIGKEIGFEAVESILKALEIKILDITNGVYSLEVPRYRVDVQRDVDVIEDILRIYGYNNVEFSDSLNACLSYAEKPDSYKLQNRISEQLTACGFNEIMNNSLTKQSYYAECQAYPLANCVTLMNALSNDLGVLRQTLLFGGLESIAYNANRKNADLKFYEFGNCYYYHPENKKEGKVLSAYSEDLHLGMWITGNRTAQTWMRPEEKTSFYELKAHVENALRRLGVNVNKLVLKPFTNDLFTDALEIFSASKRKLGIMAVVDKSVRKIFDIENEVYFADLSWAALLQEIKNNKVTYTEIPKFPGVKRDLALLIDKDVKYIDLYNAAFETERKLLTKVSLFDVYEGKNLEAGKKSYALSFILQDKEKTLNDKQIENVMTRLQTMFETKFGAKIR